MEFLEAQASSMPPFAPKSRKLCDLLAASCQDTYTTHCKGCIDCAVGLSAMEKLLSASDPRKLL